MRGEFVPIAEVFERINRDPFCPDGVKVLEQYLHERTAKPFTY
jgi:hypothetical protein